MQTHYKKTPRIGIALGAGGAKGLAHIPMLETLDELGIKPHCIAGSSFGAVIGALYASGLSGRKIREFISGLIISENERWPEALLRKDVLKWIDFIDPEIGKGGLIGSDSFIHYLYKALNSTRLEELSIPLKIVAADLWKREQIVLDSGDLPSAIKASMALPGLFSPVLLNGRLLVDGGTINPVPYDLLLDECDVVVAIDVMGRSSYSAITTPSFFETIFNSIHVLQQGIVNEKLQRHRPHIYIKPDIVDVRVLDFFEAETIYRQAEPAREQLRRELIALLD
jgi:NTE family protein